MLHDLHGGVVGGDVVTVGPVTAEEETIFAEGFPEGMQRVLVEGRIVPNTPGLVSL